MALLGLCWEPLGGLLVPLWAVLGLSWAIVGPGSAVLKLFLGPFGASGGDLGGFETVLKADEIRKANMLKL